MHRLLAAAGRRAVLVASAALVIFGVATGVRAGAATAEAEASVRRLAEQIIALLAENGLSTDEGSEHLARVIDEEANLDLLGRLVLGRHWRRADDAQKEEYLGLFRQLMLQKFVGQLRAYTGDEIERTDEVFRIAGSRRVNERDILVASEVRPPGRKPLEVTWRLRGSDDPVIIDVVVANVSLLISQRSEFAAVIERAGIDGLLAELRAQLEPKAS